MALSLEQRLDKAEDYISIGFLVILILALSPVMLFGWIVVRAATWWGKRP